VQSCQLDWFVMCSFYDATELALRANGSLTRVRILLNGKEKSPFLLRSFSANEMPNSHCQ
jgi:hypothetical protein